MTELINDFIKEPTKDNRAKIVIMQTMFLIDNIGIDYNEYVRIMGHLQFGIPEEYFLNDKNREQYGISLMKYVHKRANGLIDDNDNDDLNREVDTEDEVEAPIEKDLSELSKKEIEDKINDALDRGDFEEVKKLSAFIKESHAALTFINWLMLNE